MPSQCAFVLAVALGLAAQDALPPTLAFEVEAIKRSDKLDAGGTLGMFPGGRFRTINFDGRTLIAFAYRTRPPRVLAPSQIIGAPDWLSAERYDITAKIGPELVELGKTDPNLTPKLVQALLEHRFKLKLHRETREMPVYALVLRKPGSFGSQMHEATTDCEKERDKCRIRSFPGSLTAGSITLETLATMLTGPAGRLVFDRTGLSGKVDVALEWAGDDPASDKPSIFAAVQEQLGLKLESVREPVDVVVIDHVERPTED